MPSSHGYAIFFRRAAVCSPLARCATTLGLVLLGGVGEAHAQQFGTLEGALITRAAIVRNSVGANTTGTIGAQLTFYMARPLALEADASVGRVDAERSGTRERSTFRPFAIRAVWMPNPWGERRALVGLGYTEYGFIFAEGARRSAGAATLTMGLQQDVGRARIRLDADLLYFPREDEGVEPAVSHQLGGAIRFSVGLRAPRLCCP